MAATPPTPTSVPSTLYRLVGTLALLYLQTFHGLRVHGREHVPREGGCVVGANHVSAWDPLLLGASLPRVVHFMAKQELFRHGFWRRVYRGLHAFPVDRSGADIGAVKEALRRLQRGHAIGVFFEGTRNVRGDAAAHQGAAFLAQRAGVPLVPAAIWREGRAFHVAFGPALTAHGRSREEAARLTAELAAAVKALMPS